MNMPGIKETLVPNIHAEERYKSERLEYYSRMKWVCVIGFLFSIPNLCDVCEGYVVCVQSRITRDLYTHPSSL